MTESSLLERRLMGDFRPPAGLTNTCPIGIDRTWFDIPDKPRAGVCSGRSTMRTFAMLAVIAASFGVTQSANAQGKYYPWCARYDPYSIVCGFDTRQQCMATVSGAGGYCQQNVMPPPVAEQRTGKKRKVKRTY
jgi:Protein of unknown function (DUF3551)